MVISQVYVAFCLQPPSQKENRPMELLCDWKKTKRGRSLWATLAPEWPEEVSIWIRPSVTSQRVILLCFDTFKTNLIVSDRCMRLCVIQGNHIA